MAGPSPLPPRLEAVLGIGSDLELRTTLQHIVDSAAELTGARYAAFGMTDPGQEGLVEIRGADPGLAERAGADEQGVTVIDVPIHVDDGDGNGDGDGDSDGDGEEFGRLYLGEKLDGTRFTDADRQLLRVLAAQAGIAIGNARLYETARQRERWIEGAAAVTTALLTGGADDDALMTVAHRARLLADAAAGVILQPTDTGGMEVVTASTLDDEDPGDIVGTTITPGSPVLAQLLGGEPVFVDDAATDPRLTTPARYRFGPGMLLPLQAEGRLIGTLALPRRRGDRPYTDVERLLATQFASQAALALVLADARRRRARLAVYEDRDRIARDLHDLVVQRLFATGMMLESAQRRAVGDDDVREILGHAVDELQATVQEVRTTIFALQQPPADAPTTLRGKVLREAAGAAATLGRRPSVHFTGPVEHRVPYPVAARLLAALRHALAVAVRRPAVTRVEITVDATAVLPDGRDGVRLTVYDDGGSGDATTGAGPGTTVIWQAPLENGTLG
ncbi:GAF domain-containing sensor histidine kinase [Streptomyces graminilatus]|uniref:sensor histidine kinase n=1 Tax=Streptomyces graminilatus TaxID=1464070 RepID=UPI0006E366DF|nr:GAF domain-containing protein [Streptomyces graminilatus]